jgi:hypothetical protein
MAKKPKLKPKDNEYSYDPECESLATYFLNDLEKPVMGRDISDLSQHIQEAIESWLEKFQKED